MSVFRITRHRRLMTAEFAVPEVVALAAQLLENDEIVFYLIVCLLIREEQRFTEWQNVTLKGLTVPWCFE